MSKNTKKNIIHPLKKQIISLVNDGNNNLRKNISKYDLLLEAGFDELSIPKSLSKTSNSGFGIIQTFELNDFEVSIEFYENHYRGRIGNYKRKNKSWIDEDKFKDIYTKNSISEDGGWFELDKFQENGIYLPEKKHHLYYAQFECDSIVGGDITLARGFKNNKNGQEQSFKSKKYVASELDKITKSLHVFLKKK
jgi:hypothetical protein